MDPLNTTAFILLHTINFCYVDVFLLLLLSLMVKYLFSLQLQKLTLISYSCIVLLSIVLWHKSHTLDVKIVTILGDIACYHQRDLAQVVSFLVGIHASVEVSLQYTNLWMMSGPSLCSLMIVFFIDKLYQENTWSFSNI